MNRAAAWERLEKAVLYGLAGYPFIDFALRRSHLPLLPSWWDDAVLLLGLGLVARRVRAGQALRGSPVLRPMGIFLTLAAAVTLADLRQLAIGFEGLRATFEYMIALVIALNLVDDLEEANRYAYALIGFGTAAALIGIHQYITRAPMPAEWVGVTESLRTRAYSIVGSPNGLGSYLALMAPLALGCAAYEKALWRRAVWLAAGGILATGLLLTFSRGAWLALAAAVAVIALSFDRRLLVALLAGMMLVTAAVPPVNQRIGQLASRNYWERSMVYGGRLYRWNEAYKQMAHAPLTGAGMGRFGGAVAARRLGVMYSDNYYAKTMAESGLVGLAAFIALMAACGRLGFRVFHALRRRPERFLALGLWGGLLAVIFHNTVENIFEIPFLNTYFWFVTGLLSRLPALAGEAFGGKAPAGEEEPRP